MQLQPLENQSLCPGWKRSAYNTIANGHSNRELTVRGVKVRRIVIAIEDCDRDSEKAGNDGHGAMVGRLPALAL